MENQMIVQSLKVVEKDKLDKAIKYYTLLSSVNNIKLSDRELQLLAFTAINGNISYSTNKKEFCEMFDSSMQTINNIVSKLKKLGLLVKKDGKVKVNPVVMLDFEKDLTLVIKLISNG
jgi:predicted transcriptional regulator